MTLKVKYDFGETVYIKTDPEQLEYVVVGIVWRPNFATPVLEISHCGEVKPVYEIEISKERDEMKLMGLEKKEE